ncbi:cytochrome c biogenesis protein [Paenibacillus sp. UNCCL117]|uniref:cytochrome c biogenesis protein ResB n=1 Tax=unclassified Paenibacillus TaxID=185978 RepID=UPI000890A191|nr:MULTISPECIES: cytochrome c biogenesis protein ResB [unclassified Paenibacillus]SDC39100.1 cytochrome c biogenesis protein [Paenibacillus sp. cl123]SFW14204.1 cytochrome c biogenesis protein [Paenibacillus sp. UNCCL117]
MIHNTKCECGHQNPVGTLLCESCGKPLEDDGGEGPLEMKYDGMARRSQKANPGVIDRVWNFFSSVKVAIYLILITLLGSALGTIYPQENTFLNFDPSVYYEETYGLSGKIYYMLGLSHTFESWWFITLLFMIGTSLVVCSLDRVLPLYRALSKQQIRKHLRFITRQKVTYSGPIPGGSSAQAAEEWNKLAAKALAKSGYRVHTEGSALLAEKYRFSRWGPYINHIGLIIFLGAVLMRGIPGWHMDQHIGFPEGKLVKIPETSYYLKNEKFTLEYYTPEEMTEDFRAKGIDVPKVYETQAALFMCKADCDDPAKEPVLEEVHKQSIVVNKPLSYKGLLAYQFDFKPAPTLISVKPTLVNKETGESFGAFELSMDNPRELYTAGPYQLKLSAYFPEFAVDPKGLPMTKSRDPIMPAFVFTITGPGLAAGGEPYMYFPRQIDKVNFRQDEINGALGQKLELSVSSMDNVQISEYISYLNIRVDRAMPYIWVGAAISMIGLIMGFYWNHRRIWLRIDDGELSLGAHANKNWYGLRKEVSQVLGKTGIVIDPKALERKVEQT